MTTLPFKSIPENWEKEFKGLKPNTVRKLNPADPNDAYRLAVLTAWAKELPEDAFVEMMNTETKEVFKRKVTDVTPWEGLHIISWKHKDALTCHCCGEKSDGFYDRERKVLLCEWCDEVLKKPYGPAWVHKVTDQ